MNSILKVDDYIRKYEPRKKELIALRRILCSTMLQETIKWGAPIYTLHKKNIVGLGAFKSYVGLWFFNGALLNDPHKKLINAQKGKTNALRQWRFNSYEEIIEASAIIKEYLIEAIMNQEHGKMIKPNRDKPLIIPESFKLLLSGNKKLKQKFGAFSKSKQREFMEYIEEPKKQETKQRRLEKIVPMIINCVGLNDRYRK